MNFLKPWREWIDTAMAASRTTLGDAWVAAWLEAPIWHFVLPPRACGPCAVAGLTLPSVDRVGRHYPLTVAAVFADQPSAPMVSDMGPWLRAAEALALDALAHDQPPEVLGDALRALAPADAGAAAEPGAVWWTQGCPRVAEGRMSMPGLPDPMRFAAMIDASAAS